MTGASSELTKSRVISPSLKLAISLWPPNMVLARLARTGTGRKGREPAQIRSAGTEADKGRERYFIGRRARRRLGEGEGGPGARGQRAVVGGHQGAGRL